MIEEINHLPKIYLGPGEFHLSKEPEVVVTVLGSCIAIIMQNTEKQICAVSHCVMPDYGTYSNNNPGDSKYKYVDSAIHQMIKILNKANVEKNEITVKLFGGSEQLNEKRKNVSIGKQNVLTAIDILFEEGLQIVASDVGGNDGRKIFISTQTGDVYLSRLGNFSNSKDG